MCGDCYVQTKFEPEKRRTYLKQYNKGWDHWIHEEHEETYMITYKEACDTEYYRHRQDVTWEFCEMNDPKRGEYAFKSDPDYGMGITYSYSEQEAVELENDKEDIIEVGKALREQEKARTREAEGEQRSHHQQRWKRPGR